MNVPYTLLGTVEQCLDLQEIVKRHGQTPPKLQVIYPFADIKGGVEVDGNFRAADAEAAREFVAEAKAIGVGK